MSAEPALGETYSLTELPRVPDLPLSQRVVVAESQAAATYDATETIDLGISKSIISSYVLKPTPKLVWSYPLSPNTVVDSMDVQGSLYVIGLTERRRSRLLLLQRTATDTSVTAEVALAQPAVAVRFASHRAIHVLSKHGDFAVATYDTAPLHIAMAGPLANITRLATSSTQVVYSCFVSRALAQGKHDMLFYITSAATSENLIYRLVALDGAKSFEVYQVSGAAPGAAGSIFTHSEGVLYTLDAAAQTITSRTIMKPLQPQKTVAVERLLQAPAASDLIALSAVSADRLLLSCRSSVFLVNFKFESLLSEHTNNSGNQVYLAYALPVAGTSPETTSSFALYLNYEQKTKTCKLKSIQVSVGLNLLSESIGKGMAPPPAEQWNGVPHLAEDDLVKANADNLQAMHGVMESLRAAQAAKTVGAFEQKALDFLKKAAHKGDRVVDHKFVESVLALVLSLDDDGAVKLVADDFLPVSLLKYLLKHPLYPVRYTNGLLLLLSALGQPRLLKHAIQSCATITLDELMTEFTNLTELSEELSGEDEKEAKFVAEFLRITIDRLLKDYSLAEITSKLSDVLTVDYEADSKKLERMLNVLINTNTHNSWLFVQAVIDVGGLFNWSIPTISALAAVIDDKVDTLVQNSYNLTLTNQAVLSLKHSGKSKKKAAAKVVDDIHEKDDQRTQLDAILTLANNTANRRLRVDDGIELAKQIPTYSREKLIL